MLSPHIYINWSASMCPEYYYCYQWRPWGTSCLNPIKNSSKSRKKGILFSTGIFLSSEAPERERGGKEKQQKTTNMTFFHFLSRSRRPQQKKKERKMNFRCLNTAISSKWIDVYIILPSCMWLCKEEWGFSSLEQ